MKVHVIDLKVGDQLLQDTFNAHGLHLLSRNKKLSQFDIAKLLQHQITYVDIQRNETEPLQEDHNSSKEDVLLEIRPLYDQAVKQTEILFHEAEINGRFDPNLVNKTFRPLINCLKRQHNVVDLLLKLNDKDQNTYQHTIQVGMLSYYIAKSNKYTEEEAQYIAIAGYLHDIGKCRIQADLLHKSDQLTPEEEALVAKHTQYGYEMISNSNYSYTIALAALQHHERIDGSGYPMHLSGSNISPYAKIIMVADLYCNLLSNRTNNINQDLFTVLQQLYELSFSAIDPEITLNFISHMLPNFIGKKLVLDTEEIGKIIMIKYNDYFRPLIQIKDYFLDLAEKRQIKIKQVIY